MLPWRVRGHPLFDKGIQCILEIGNKKSSMTSRRSSADTADSS
jgi:hypothetical protein